ncbi:MAG: hypothetical protein YK1309IOTA_2010005 [Marine Group I thaumarchaeote]|nr:MAG: hypothetical protein YK1309IOTA_2010005 [Marine Group I thaumarchaeote]
MISLPLGLEYFLKKDQKYIECALGKRVGTSPKIRCNFSCSI